MRGPLFSGDFLVLLIVLTAAALSIAGGLWGLAEARNTMALRESLRATTSKARALLRRGMHGFRPAGSR
jgi:hypothetical protein